MAMRRASSEDAAKLLAFFKAHANQIYPALHPSVDEFMRPGVLQRQIATGEKQYFFFEQGRRIVGVIGVTLGRDYLSERARKNVAYVDVLLAHPEVRRVGVGSKLLDFAEEQMHHAGMEELWTGTALYSLTHKPSGPQVGGNVPMMRLLWRRGYEEFTGPFSRELLGHPAFADWRRENPGAGAVGLPRITVCFRKALRR